MREAAACIVRGNAKRPQAAPMSATSDPAEIDLPDFAAVESAAARIAPHAQKTPVRTSRSIDAAAGAELVFKCENLQRAGAFKFRGASNAIWSLPDDVAARHRRGGSAADDNPRPSAHGRVTCYQRRSERQGGAANAWPRFCCNDSRHIQRPLR